MVTSKLLFSTAEVTKQAFYKSSLSYAIVNLKPIVPGHVLVIPTRIVPRLTDLNESEVTSLMKTVQTVGRVVEKAYGADGLTIACQDGKAAGQSMPHVHFHILPRKLQGDRFSANNDDVYPALEESESGLHRNYTTPSNSTQAEGIRMDADENRIARSSEEMEKEAQWLSGFFTESM